MSINNLEQIINLKVKITTLLDQTIIGYIYSFSSSYEVLSLRIPEKKDIYRIINTSFIKSIQVLPPFPNKKSTSNKYNNLVLNPIDINKLDEFLQSKIIEYKVEPVSVSTSSSVSTANTGSKKSPPIVHRLYDKFVKLYGKDKVRYNSNQHDIIIFEEIKISKPFTLNKSNFHKLKVDSIHGDSVYRALKQFWLEVDNEKRGG
ncbi:hypothetical protein JA1_004046 [Spathaspora sp. JA1]|nr:hypothetical protein JA1_004046 [Spathaspora sp. JA1]